MVAVLRLVEPNDVDGLHRLIDDNHDDVVGMSSLPDNRADVERLVEESVLTEATARRGDDTAASCRRQLLFVLDDEGPGGSTIAGVTGVTIDSGSAMTVWRVTNGGTAGDLVARLMTERPSRIELGSTYLAPGARGRGLGRLLSHGRLLWATEQASALPAIVMAHIRGRIDADGSPFWDGMGGTELGIDVHAALERCRDIGTVKTLESLPHRTLELERAVRAGMGQLHEASVPAWGLLVEQGLEPNGMIDPIDGGQTIAAPLIDTSVHRTTERRLVRRTCTGDAVPRDVGLVARADGPFRAISTSIALWPNAPASLGADELDALRVSHGDDALVTPSSSPATAAR